MSLEKEQVKLSRQPPIEAESRESYYYNKGLAPFYPTQQNNQLVISEEQRRPLALFS